MLPKTKKIMITTATGLAVLLAFGSGTLLATHAANDVSSVSQTDAPTTATAASTKLTAEKTRGTKQNYTVTYADQHGEQRATFKQKTMGTATTAKEQVDYVGQKTAGATVKLTGQTQAIAQGVMGHTYVHWNTGQWSVTAVTDNADATGTPTQFAKQINAQLAKRDLPTTQSGAITVYSGTDNHEANTVQWQSGKRLYTVSGQSAASTVKLAQNSR